MTRKTLENYQINKRLIKRNKEKIEEEQFKEIPIVRGKVIGSSSEFPYIERRFSVEMDEPIKASERMKKIKKWKDEIASAEEEIKETEEFIEGIQEVKIKEIFTYRYLDGISVSSIANRIGYTKGRVSQIIKKFLKD